MRRAFPLLFMFLGLLPSHGCHGDRNDNPLGGAAMNRAEQHGILPR
jgi:hypothetical protein